MSDSQYINVWNHSLNMLLHHFCSAPLLMASSDPAEAASSLIYPFSPETLWDYFRLGAPLSSSVERGQRKNVYKSKKIYCRKRRRTFNARSNRPHQEIATMSLLCSCDGGCLMRRPAPECREMIDLLREALIFLKKNLQRAKLHSSEAHGSPNLH